MLTRFVESVAQPAVRRLAGFGAKGDFFRREQDGSVECKIAQYARQRPGTLALHAQRHVDVGRARQDDHSLEAVIREVGLRGERNAEFGGRHHDASATSAETKPAAGTKLCMRQPQCSPGAPPTRRMRAGSPGASDTSKRSSGCDSPSPSALMKASLRVQQLKKPSERSREPSFR